MTTSAKAALLVSLALALGCSSNNAPLMHDGGGVDKAASDAPAKDAPADMATTDAPATDAPSNDAPAMDAPSNDAIDAPAGDAADAKLDGATDAITISDGPLCSTDASTAADAGGACESMFMVQISMHPPDSTTTAFGDCGGYHVWLRKTGTDTTLCLYDTSPQSLEKLLGVAQFSGTMSACSGPTATLPAKCAELITYAPPPKPDPSAELDGGADAPPNPAIEASLKTGLVALWTLDGDAKDHSGHGLDLTVNGLSYVAGRHGSGLQFVGDLNKLATRPMSDPSLAVQRGDFTISLWVSLDPDFHMNQGFLDDGVNWSIGTPGPGNAWIIQSDVGGVAGGHGLDSGFGWRHVVAERSGSALSLYSSGVIVNNGESTVNNPSTPPSAETFRLGSWMHALPMSGVLDDVAIWNRALTAEERAYLGTHPATVVP